MIIQSGRQNIGLKPSLMQSASEMPLRMRWACSADSIFVASCSSVASCSESLLPPPQPRRTLK